MQHKILILGAGPKAVALATKHRVLGQKGLSLPPYTVIERATLAAHWDGQHGFTDGDQELVTPPEQDLGFPYTTDWLAPLGLKAAQLKEINESMLSYSWSAFLSEQGQRADELLGLVRPTHRLFVDYLSWAAKKAEMQISTADAVQIDTSNSTWNLHYSDLGQAKQFSGTALVITGNGTPRYLRGQPLDANDRTLDGLTFWKNLDKIDQLPAGARIAVVGTGETAAAIASAIVDRDSTGGRQIDLISEQPSYLPRSFLVDDLKYFADPDFYSWRGLPVSWRRGIIRRADRGVVSPATKQKLENSSNVRYFLSTEISWVGTSGSDIVLATEGRFDRKEEIRYAMVIVAVGFDPLWFMKILDSESRQRLIQSAREQFDPSCELLLKAVERRQGLDTCRELETNLAANRDEFLRDNLQNNRDINQWFVRCLEASIQLDLSVKDFEPKLHLPMLSGLEQGPGFPNLNCLGLLSNRIWKSYASLSTES